MDGIEASADVTDTTNVTAAGALMDSEVTNLAQVKAFDSADYATAAQGTTAEAALPKSGGAMTGAITTNSTFDGRDVATDGTKLDGIEASADVTDTANVTAAGALMDSELTSIASVKALDQGVATTDSPTFAGLTTSADVSFGDNDKAIFGAGSDLQIYHDGTNSIISDTGAGSIVVRSSDSLFLQGANGDDYLVASLDGSVSLFYDNNSKLATTSTGIDVTGTATMDSLNVDSAGKIGFNTTGTYTLNSVPSPDYGLGYTVSTNPMNLSGYYGLAFATARTERMRIDSSGNVGIGESNPQELLHLTATTPVFRMQGGSRTYQQFVSGTTFTIRDVNAGANRVNIDSSGYVTIGSAGLSADAGLKFQADTGTFTLNHERGSHSLVLSDSDGTGEVLRVDTSGNLLVGTTATDTAAVGFRYRSSLDAISSVADGGISAYFGRRTSDGDIVAFRKDDAIVGSIGTESGNVFLNSASTGLLSTVGTARYKWDADQFYPNGDNAKNLGTTANRFKDLCLSGTATMGSLNLGGGSGEKLYVYDGGSVKAGFGVDLSGASRELSMFHSTSATNGNISFGKRLESNGAYTEAMRIDGSGNLLVGKTASGTAQGFEVQSDGEVYCTIANGLNTYHVYANSGYRFYVKPDGGIVNYSSNNVNLSDEREKKNIENLESQWDSLKQWSLKKFHYNADADSDSKKLGVIAQEVETHNPEVIDEFNVDDDTTRMAVKEQQMMWMAIKALQEAQTRIETLEARVTELENN